MREGSEEMQVTHVVFAPELLDAAAVAELDARVERGARTLVLDLSAAQEVDDETILLLDWLAQRLENAGGSLRVTAGHARRRIQTSKTFRGCDPTSALGVHAALDRAIMRRLWAGAGGAATW